MKDCEMASVRFTGDGVPPDCVSMEEGDQILDKCWMLEIGQHGLLCLFCMRRL
jgi:hypothetical protein